jgi:hypothetical protein
LVEIRRYDVQLFGEIGRSSYNVVPAIFDLGDPSDAVRHHIERNPITNSDRVCAFNAFDPEVSLHSAFVKLAIVSFDKKTASGTFDY